MKVKVAKWGNSLGVRLPKSAADVAGVRAGTELELTVEGRDLRLRSMRKTSAHWPTNVVLPEGLKTEGTILVDQIRWIDRQQCLFDFIETVPREILTEVHAKLAALLDINFDGVPG